MREGPPYPPPGQKSPKLSFLTVLTLMNPQFRTGWLQTTPNCLHCFFIPESWGLELSMSTMKLDKLTGTWNFQKSAKVSRLGGTWFLRAWSWVLGACPSFHRVLRSVVLMSPS